MRKTSYIPPNVLPVALQRMSSLLRKKWVREIILLPSTISRRRFSNKTQDYGVFKPSLVSHLDQISIYVRSIEVSRRWYEELAFMVHSRTTEPELHPYKPGYVIECCYMSSANHPECLVLVEERHEKGRVNVPSGMSFFHFALELKNNRVEDVLAFAAYAKEKGYEPHYGPVRHNDIPPLGDGETGGNTAVYFYDPDYNNVEFCASMDTIEKYTRNGHELVRNYKSER